MSVKVYLMSSERAVAIYCSTGLATRHSFPSCVPRNSHSHCCNDFSRAITPIKSPLSASKQKMMNILRKVLDKSKLRERDYKYMFHPNVFCLFCVSTSCYCLGDGKRLRRI